MVSIINPSRIDPRTFAPEGIWRIYLTAVQGLGAAKDAVRMARIAKFYERLPKGAAPDRATGGPLGWYQAKYFGKNPSAARKSHLSRHDEQIYSWRPSNGARSQKRMETNDLIQQSGTWSSVWWLLDIASSTTTTWVSHYKNTRSWSLIDYRTSQEQRSLEWELDRLILLANVHREPYLGSHTTA